MNNKNKNWVKKVIPVIAVLVLAESLMLILNINKVKIGKGEVVDNSTPTEGVKPTSTEPIYMIELGATSEEMTVGKAEKIEVKAKAEEDRSLDSINVYLEYDPSAFTVSGLTFDDRLPEPVFSKASDTKGLVVATFLISKDDGLTVNKDDELNLMSFSVKPLKSGDFTFKISTGNESKESATMFVESATSKVLPFSSNELSVRVTK